MPFSPDNHPLFWLLAIGLVSFTLAVLATPAMLAIARRIGLLDLPSVRKAHGHPTPMLGGLAIYFSFLAVMVAFSRSYPRLSGVVIGATVILLCGLIDDARGLSAKAKLVGQLAAAVILVHFGVRAELTGYLLVDFIVSVLWAVGMINAFNLLDNMDGLSAGVAGIASWCFFVLAFHSQQYLVGAAAIALYGGCMGFLRFNFPPASIFMGDTGSMFLGYALSAISLSLARQTDVSLAWLTPVLVLGLPIADTSSVIIARWRGGRPIMQAGRDHLSHRLLGRGFTVRSSAQTLYLASTALGFWGISNQTSSIASVVIASSLTAALALVLVVKTRSPVVQHEPLPQPTAADHP